MLSECGGQLTHSKSLPSQPCADCVVTYTTCIVFVINIFPPWLTCSSNSMFFVCPLNEQLFSLPTYNMNFFTCPLSLLYPVYRAGSFCSAVLTQKKKKGSLTNELVKQMLRVGEPTTSTSSKVQKCVALTAPLATFRCSHLLPAASSVNLFMLLNFHLKLPAGSSLRVIQLFEGVI